MYNIINMILIVNSKKTKHAKHNRTLVFMLGTGEEGEGGSCILISLILWKQKRLGKGSRLWSHVVYKLKIKIFLEKQ